MHTEWHELIDRLSRGRFLVVGDLILDHHVWGEVDRVSPEAPVPVLDIRGEEHAPGGAANVACKIAELGGRVTLAGVVGRDEAGSSLRQKVEALDVDCAGLVVDEERPTAVKTRYIARSQQLLRVDREKRDTIGAGLEKALIGRVSGALHACDGVAVIDYRKGALSHGVLRAALSRSPGVPAVVDPRGEDWSRYRGATVITPNRREAEIASRRSVRTEEESAAAGAELLRQSGADAIAITRGPEGITLVRPGGATHFPTVRVEVYDVTGAGDAVSSVFLMGLAGGLSLEQCTELANLAGGLIVQQIGVGRISREAMGRAAAQWSGTGAGVGKLVTLEQAANAAQRVRSGGGRTVFTNGCFDLVHPGHVHLLEECRKLGDFLVVGLNSDESITRIKGPGRPILLEAERAAVLAALSPVDLVVIFDEDTPRRLIETIRPEVLAKGGEYTEDQIVGAKFVRSYGGEVARIPLVAGHSTSDIVSRVQSAEAAGTPARRAWKDE